MFQKKTLWALAILPAILFAASSYTPNYNLELPQDGDTNWGAAIRTNFSTIDTQMFVNQEGIADHIANPTDAHMATAIGATGGATLCLAADDVQEYLDCLESNLGPIIGGTVMTTNTDQDVTGIKTFVATPLMPSLLEGILHNDSLGNLSSSLIVNADVDPSAAIAQSKLSLSITDAEVNASAAIAQSKLALSITNAEVNASAAIAQSKLAALTASRAAVTGVSGFIEAATTTATEIGYVNGVTSAIQTQLNGKQAGPLTGDVTTSGAAATLATVNANVGSFGSSTSIPSFTVNAKGLLTAASGNAVIAPAGTLSGATLAAGVTASSLTSVGTLATGVWNASVIGMTYGGSGKNLTPNAGGVVWTDSDSMEVVAPGSSGQVLTSGGTGTPTWSTPLTNPMDSTGDMIYGGASGVATKLDSGTLGQSLVSGGAAAPTWSFNGGTVVTITSANSPYTPALNVRTIIANATSGAITINIPAASNSNYVLEVIKSDTSTNLITIDPNSSETISGQATMKMSGQNDYMKIVSDGTNLFTPQAFRTAAVYIDFSASSAVNSDPFKIVSSVGNISAGSATTTLVTGIFSSTPIVASNIMNAGSRLEKFTAVPSSATSISHKFRESAATGSATTIQDSTTANLSFVLYGPR